MFEEQEKVWQAEDEEDRHTPSRLGLYRLLFGVIVLIGWLVWDLFFKK